MTIPESGYQLTALFHGDDYIDGSVCPGRCSTRGDCSSGVCSCLAGWRGDSCEYSVIPITAKRSYDFNFNLGNFTLEINQLSIAEVTWKAVGGSGDFQSCVLAGPYGKYDIPSEDYASTCTTGSGGFQITEKLPMFIRISPLQQEQVISLVFAYSQGSSSSSDITSYIIIAVLVPTTIVFCAVMMVVFVLRYKAHRRQRREPSPGLPLIVPEAGKQVLEMLNAAAPAAIYADTRSLYSSDCAVCLEAFEMESRVRMLQCGHVYHSLCLEHLAVRQQTCCVCKQPFEKKTESSVLTTISEGTQRRE